MITLLDINARVSFTLTRDISEPKTEFILRPLTGPEKLDLTRFFKIETGPDKKPRAFLSITGDYARTILTRAIVEIKNIGEGKAIPEVVDSLSPDDLIELVKKIGEMNSLTEQEVKN